MCRSLDNAWKILFPGKWRIEVSDGVYRVKEAQEVDPNFSPAKGCLEAMHIMLSLLRRFESTDPHLVFLVGPVREWYHFLVPFGQQSDCRDHPCQESSGEGTSGETEDEDLVMLFVVTHDETIAGDDMVIEACAECQVYGLGIPPFDLPP